MRQRQAIPHQREFLADTLTPLGVYRRLEAVESGMRQSFLLESVTGGEQVSRFSFLGSAPSEVYALYLDRLEIERPGGEREVLEGSPLERLRELSVSVASERGAIPFLGGLVGYFGYDLIRLLENLPNRPPDTFDLPIALLGRYDSAVVFDHARQRVLAVSNEIEGEVSRSEADARLDELGELLTRLSESGALPVPEHPPPPAQTKPPTLSADDFRDAVRKAKEYIRAGDIFQVVPSRRFEVDGEVDPETLYRALRMINPSPYMVLFESPRVSIVGGSPEMLVRATGDRFETHPIAGTRRRGSSPQEDERLAREMLADPKERAEHVMLVDLGRNDLGRVAAPGGVEVKSFMEVEYYSHVMHIVSRVEAERAPDATALDALLACFPAGTLSGAPKIRAMEIIDELEPEARGLYGGAVGYLSYGGDMDTCITIRTLVVEPSRDGRPGRTTVTAGGGIVADSDPDLEVEETRNKAAALLQTVALARHLSETEAASSSERPEESTGEVS